MSVEMNVPEIRFKGFSGEWESKKLGNTVTYIKGFAFKSSDYGSHGTRIVRVSDLTRSSLSESSGKIYISNSKAGLYSNYEIKSGDIVITTVGSKAEMRESAVGRAIVFTKSEGHLLNQNLVKVTPANENESQFIYNQLLREQYARFIEDIQRGNANQANIAIGDLWEYSLKFPKTKPEQTAIGNTFQKLDSLINQHQQKHDKLSSIKKAMLEKMFPKQGETMPEIRFKGFSGDWEEKELGSDVADIIGGGTPSTSISEFWGGDIDWYSPTEIGDNVYAEGSQKKITALGLKSSSAKILPAGNTILFTSRAGIGDMAILARPGATNQGFQSFVVKEGYSPYFLYSAGNQIKDFALNHASGSTFLEISGKQLGRMKILIPCENEQAAIGNYFQKLDTLINQHQQQITKLNNIKQACLSKMFI